MGRTKTASPLNIPILGDIRLLPNSCVALTEHPHLHEKLKALWGFFEFFDYVDGLMFSERSTRAGFSDDALFEIALLRHTFVTRWEEVVNPFVSANERANIKKRVTPKDAVSLAILHGDS